jgi:predicted nucleic acid-binding protein
VAATYLDSSAIVKLVATEPETDALRRHLRRQRTLVSNALARTEVLRAVLLIGKGAMSTAVRVLSRIDLVGVNDQVLGDAGALLPIERRAPDAIHLATARRIGRALRSEKS